LEEQTSDTAQDYVQVIIRNAMRLKKLVTDMLNLQHLEVGEQELELESVRLSDVVHAVVKELVEPHQGKVGVESQLEMGSTIFFAISRHLVPQPESD
jgi:signal transduction histidine kinase